jgi:hypothetical protein
MDELAEESLAGRRVIARFAEGSNFFAHAADSIFAGFPLALSAFAYAA